MTTPWQAAVAKLSGAPDAPLADDEIIIEAGEEIVVEAWPAPTAEFRQWLALQPTNAPPPGAPATGTCWQECARCRRGRCLLAQVGDIRVCAECWNRMGRPFPRQAVDPQEVELQARESMLKRGGSDRYRVRAGKT